MFEKLKQHPSVIGYRKQYEMLPSRDRMGVKLITVLSIAALVYLFIWQPAFQFRKEAQRTLEQRSQLLSLIVSNKQTLKNLSKNSQSKRSSLDSQQLVSSVTNLAKSNGVALKRFEPSGDNKLKVWLDNASFDKVISWLSILKRSLNISVEQISIDKDDLPGQVSARLTLSS